MNELVNKLPIRKCLSLTYCKRTSVILFVYNWWQKCCSFSVKRLMVKFKRRREREAIEEKCLIGLNAVESLELFIWMGSLNLKNNILWILKHDGCIYKHHLSCFFFLSPVLVLIFFFFLFFFRRRYSLGCIQFDRTILVWLFVVLWRSITCSWCWEMYSRSAVRSWHWRCFVDWQR